NDGTAQCLTVSATLTASWSNLPALELRECDDSRSDQGFQIDIVAQTIFPPAVLACEAHGPERHFSWLPLIGYEHAVDYKIHIGGLFYMNHGNRYYQTLHLTRDDLSAYPPGTHLIEVYQSVHGGAWTLTATRDVVKPVTGDISCG